MDLLATREACNPLELSRDSADCAGGTLVCLRWWQDCGGVFQRSSTQAYASHRHILMWLHLRDLCGGHKASRQSAQTTHDTIRRNCRPDAQHYRTNPTAVLSRCGSCASCHGTASFGLKHGTHDCSALHRSRQHVRRINSIVFEQRLQPDE